MEEEVPPPHVADSPPSIQQGEEEEEKIELISSIVKQVEYYFSDDNLPTDQFLMKYLTKDAEGFIPIDVIASFRKMKKLTQDRSLIVVALKNSSLLVVSSDEKSVKRLHPLPSTEVRDPELCTVLVENLPEDHSIENIHKIFGVTGSIKKVNIHDPNAAREQRKLRLEEKLLSNKLHAVVEYECIEAAEKAVTTLNNEEDWRYGMRVKLLKKKGKHKQVKKVQDSGKNNDAHASDPSGAEENHLSSEHHDYTHNESEEQLAKEDNGRKGQKLRKPRKQKHRSSNGHGHGTLINSHASEISRPPPGPRMPDGTRGFAMGRGRPLNTQSQPGSTF